MDDAAEIIFEDDKLRISLDRDSRELLLRVKSRLVLEFPDGLQAEEGGRMEFRLGDLRLPVSVLESLLRSVRDRLS